MDKQNGNSQNLTGVWLLLLVSRERQADEGSSSGGSGEPGSDHRAEEGVQHDARRLLHDPHGHRHESQGRDTTTARPDSFTFLHLWPEFGQNGCFLPQSMHRNHLSQDAFSLPEGLASFMLAADGNVLW